MFSDLLDKYPGFGKAGIELTLDQANLKLMILLLQPLVVLGLQAYSIILGWLNCS
jgi:hypothetical protein